jgi:hypothetical protein
MITASERYAIDIHGDDWRSVIISDVLDYWLRLEYPMISMMILTSDVHKTQQLRISFIERNELQAGYRVPLIWNHTQAV